MVVSGTAGGGLAVNQGPGPQFPPSGFLGEGAQVAWTGRQSGGWAEVEASPSLRGYVPTGNVRCPGDKPVPSGDGSSCVP